MNKPIKTPTTQQIPLKDKAAMVGFQEFKGSTYFVFRFLYRDSFGELAPGKNGINIPEELALPSLQEMVKAYNEYYGTNYQLKED